MSGGWLPPSDAAYVPPATAPDPAASYGRAPVPAAGGGPAHAAGVPGERAGYGSRLGAAALDFLVRLAIALPIVAAVIGLGDLADELTADPGDSAAANLGLTGDLLLAGAIAGIAGAIYATVAMTLLKGQTLGHRVTGTRVVRDDGTPVTGGRALVREGLVKYLLFEGLGGLVLIPTLLNYLWPLWDGRDQALHDKLCGTHVVRA